jgi:hypothetical protein
MKHRLACLTSAVLVVLAGCGGDTCTSAAAPLQDETGNKTCTLAPGQLATFSIQLCGRCTDSAASCQAEFVNGQIEIAPVVQQCQAESSCGVTPSCAVTPSTATCQLTIPASVTSGTPISVQANSQQGSPIVVTDTLQVGSGTSCTL